MFGYPTQYYGRGGDNYLFPPGGWVILHLTTKDTKIIVDEHRFVPSRSIGRIFCPWARPGGRKAWHQRERTACPSRRTWVQWTCASNFFQKTKNNKKQLKTGAMKNITWKKILLHKWWNTTLWRENIGVGVRVKLARYLLRRGKGT